MSEESYASVVGSLMMLWFARDQTLLKQWELSADHEQPWDGALESCEVDPEISEGQFRYDIVLWRHERSTDQIY